MKITLPQSLLVGLDRQHLRLIDVSCRANENKTHYFLQSQLTGCKNEAQTKRRLFFSIATWFLKYPSKRTRVRVTSKENGQTGGAGVGGGGGGDYYIFPSKEGDYSREAINRGTTIIGGNTTPSNCSSFQIQEERLKSFLKHPLHRCLIVCVLLIYLNSTPTPSCATCIGYLPAEWKLHNRRFTSKAGDQGRRP